MTRVAVDKTARPIGNREVTIYRWNPELWVCDYQPCSVVFGKAVAGALHTETADYCSQECALLRLSHCGAA